MDAGKGNDSDLENLVKDFTVELNELTISAALKVRMRELLGAYGRRVLTWKKEQANAQSDGVIAKVLSFIEGATGNKLVARVDFGVDIKLAKLVQASVGKVVKDKAVMIISADPNEDRYMVVSFSPKGFNEIDCKLWALSALEGLDAKGGGKSDSAQYTVEGISSIDSVVAKATIFNA